MTCSWQVFCSRKANKERENKNHEFPLVRFWLPQSYLLHSQLAEPPNSVSIQDGKNLICTHEISPRAWMNPTVGCLGIKPNQSKPINSTEGHPVKSARLGGGAFLASYTHSLNNGHCHSRPKQAQVFFLPLQWAVCAKINPALGGTEAALE